MGDSGNGNSDTKCQPGTGASGGAIGKGIANGFTSFFGWGDVYNSLGGEDQTESLQKQADQLQAQIPKLILACAKQQDKINSDMLEAAEIHLNLQ